MEGRQSKRQRLDSEELQQKPDSVEMMQFVREALRPELRSIQPSSNLGLRVPAKAAALHHARPGLNHVAPAPAAPINPNQQQQAHPPRFARPGLSSRVGGAQHPPLGGQQAHKQQQHMAPPASWRHQAASHAIPDLGQSRSHPGAFSSHQRPEARPLGLHSGQQEQKPFSSGTTTQPLLQARSYPGTSHQVRPEPFQPERMQPHMTVPYGNPHHPVMSHQSGKMKPDYAGLLGRETKSIDDSRQAIHAQTAVQRSGHRSMSARAFLGSLNQKTVKNKPAAKAQAQDYGQPSSENSVPGRVPSAENDLLQHDRQAILPKGMSHDQEQPRSDPARGQSHSGTGSHKEQHKIADTIKQKASQTLENQAKPNSHAELGKAAGVSTSRQEAGPGPRVIEASTMDCDSGHLTREGKSTEVTPPKDEAIKHESIPDTDEEASAEVSRARQASHSAQGSDAMQITKPLVSPVPLNMPSPLIAAQNVSQPSQDQLHSGRNSSVPETQSQQSMNHNPNKAQPVPILCQSHGPRSNNSQHASQVGGFQPNSGRGMAHVMEVGQKRSQPGASQTGGTRASQGEGHQTKQPGGVSFYLHGGNSQEALSNSKEMPVKPALREPHPVPNAAPAKTFQSNESMSSKGQTQIQELQQPVAGLADISQAAFLYPEDFSLADSGSARPDALPPAAASSVALQGPITTVDQDNLEGSQQINPGSQVNAKEFEDGEDKQKLEDSVGDTDEEEGAAVAPAISQPAIFSQVPPELMEKTPQTYSLEMTDYLGPLLVDVYREANLKQLYPWQAECLNLPGVQSEGRNLVYSAPTGAGKSAVAEVLTLCRWDVTGKCALYVLPYVALCEQKSQSLNKLLRPLNRGVKDYFGHLSKLGTLEISTTAAIVCTIEKANTLINKLLEEGTLNKLISTVVVDELHMVGDEERGYLLELLLTKLRYIHAKSSLIDVGSEVSSLQIIGMSATMPNLHQVAQWLDAEVYETKFRPVELELSLKNGSSLLGTDLSYKRALSPSEGWDKSDTDFIAWLCKETIATGHSALIFCGTRKSCEETALLVGRLLKLDDTDGARSKILGQLEALSSNKILHQAVSMGAAFHTSSLTGEERRIVEAGFLAGAIRVIAATMTLAAGVNLPARRVILRHHWVREPSLWLTTTQIQQMAGRAGRAGLDTKGEVVLVCPPRCKDIRPFAALLEGTAQNVESCLHQERKGMTRALMEVVSSGIVTRASDIQQYVYCTLLFATQDKSEFEATARDSASAALRWLKENKFLKMVQDPDDMEKGGLWQATPLGLAASASGLTPAQALMVHQDLSNAQDNYVMRYDLHLTYLVTPVAEDLLSTSAKTQQGQWCKFLNMYNRSNNQLRSIAEVCGITPDFCNRLHTRQVPDKKDEDQARMARRFYAAVVLLRLINEGAPRDVEKEFELKPYSLESLKDRATGFAGMVAAFCQRMGFSQLELLIAKFQERVQHGVMPELVELARIQGVKGYRARQLYNAGLRTVKDVADASATTIEHVITKGVAGERQGEQKVGHEREMALRIRKAAKKLLFQDLQEYLKEHGGEKLLKIGADGLSTPPLSGPSQEASQALAALQASQLQLTPQAVRDTPTRPHQSMGPPANRAPVGPAKLAANQLPAAAPLHNPAAPMHGTSSQQQPRQRSQTWNTPSSGLGKESIKPVTQQHADRYFEGQPLAAPGNQNAQLTAHNPARNEMIGDGFRSLDKSQQGQLPQEAREALPANTALAPHREGFSLQTSGPAQVERTEMKLSGAAISASGLQNRVGKEFSSASLQTSTAFYADGKGSAKAASNGQMAHVPKPLKKRIVDEWDEDLDGPQSKANARTVRNNPNVGDCSHAPDPNELGNKPAPDTPSRNLQSSRAEEKQSGLKRKREAEPIAAFEIIKEAEDIGKFDALITELERATHFLFEMIMPARMAKDPFQASVIQVGVKQHDISKFIQGIGITVEGTAWFISPKLAFLPHLRRIFSLQTLKVCYDLKKQLNVLHLLSGMLQRQGEAAFTVMSPVVDVRIAQFVLTPDSPAVTDSPEVEEIRQQKGYLQEPLGGLDMLLTVNHLRKGFTGSNVNKKLPQSMQNLWVRLLALECLHVKQQKELKSKNLTQPLMEIEMAVAFVLSNMECKGICLDPSAYARHKAPLQRRQEEIDRLVDQEAGFIVDLGNTKAVRKALFETLQIPVPNSKTTRTGKPRTDAETLAEIDHPVARYIVEYRQIEKLLQNLDSYCSEKEVRRVPSKKHAELLRITASWLQTNSDTGRISVENPNMQCVPKPKTFMVPNTQLKDSREFEANLRAAFVAQPGWTMISGDYKQQELRIMAHLSRDERLCALLHEDGDPFQLIAADWHSIPPSEVTEQTRDHVKQLVYGLNYGMGASTLAKKMGCSVEVAKEYLNGLQTRYPDLHKWTVDVVEACRNHPDNCVQTLGGRLRFLPKIKGNDRNWSSEAERKARNTVPQGSAADIAKIAMVNLHTQIQAKLPGRCNIVLMIHDELVIEVADECKLEGARMLRRCMQDAWELLVPLAIQLREGRSWGEMVPLSGV